tara:strand:+ start:2336 stop:4156 length:1821 start_codon:yes stop_codon:yes gene_type:complete
MISAELKRALSIDDFGDRRKELRNLTSFRLSKHYAGNHFIADAYNKSPLVGDGANQVTPRPTPSGLVSALDEDTMIALLAGECTAKEILDAIIAPQVTSSTGKTGFKFGRPVGVSDGRRDDLVRQIEQGVNGYDTSTFSLDDLFKLHDFTLDKSGRTSDEVLTAMSVIFKRDPQKVDALRAAITVRSSQPTPPELKDLPENVRLAHNELMNIFKGTSLIVEEEEEPQKEELVAPSEKDAQVIDLLLTQQNLPKIGELIGMVKDAQAKADAVSAPVAIAQTNNADIPSGTKVMRSASDVFKIKGSARQAFNFKIPTFDWDAPHPHVPLIDNEYIFDPTLLMRTLFALLKNKRMYLHGHTGSGKTTFVEQCLARMNWPCMRVNFDSEITRMDLVGRDTLVQEGGTTVSKFVEGIMPQAMAGPYVLLCDEIDFVRPDISYVMQRAFEGNGLMLTEDGGRVVVPHESFRIVATGNTVGQGDEFGMYQGARPQSMAMLDRFTVWAHVDYLNASERRKLIEKKAPQLAKDHVDNVVKYVEEHLTAFKDSKVLQPITPRGFVDLSNAMVSFLSVYPAHQHKKAIQEALDATILDRCSAQDRAVIKGIINRIFV